MICFQRPIGIHSRTRPCRRSSPTVVRRSAWHAKSFLPVELMQEAAAQVTNAGLRAAADYFSAQTLRRRVTVVERARIPRMQATQWIYIIDPEGGLELLGQRVIEWAPDLSRHEKRDNVMRYVAFVPPGSIRRGREITVMGKANAIAGAGAGAACISCHGVHLQGIGSAPPLAGRSTTYLLRQLVAFQTKDRSGPDAALMQAEVANLQLSDMIALAAYAASR